MKIKKVLELSNREIIVGSGDKRNKEFFFKYLYPDIVFKELNFLPDKLFLWNEERKLILCDYFNNTALKLDGLRTLFYIIKNIQGKT